MKDWLILWTSHEHRAAIEKCLDCQRNTALGNNNSWHLHSAALQAQVYYHGITFEFLVFHFKEWFA